MTFAQQAGGAVTTAVAEFRELNGNDAELAAVVAEQVGGVFAVQPQADFAGLRQWRQ